MSVSIVSLPPGVQAEMLYFNIKCLEPVYLGSQKLYGLFRESAPILRGTRILGLLAKNIERHPHAPELYNLLLEDESALVVYDALPNVDQRSDEVVQISATNGAVIPMPITAQTCKCLPGFHRSWKDKSDKDKPHGVWDTLLSLWTERNPITSCPKCHSGIDAFTGYALHVPQPDEDLYIYCEQHQERRAHSARNRRTDTAAQGMLYTNRLIPAYSDFWLQILVRGRNETELERRKTNLLELLTGTHKLGGGLSRGLGTVEIKQREPDSPDYPTIASRINSFNKMLAEVYNISNGKLFFSVTLLSRGLPELEGRLPLANSQELHDALFPELKGCTLEFFQHRFGQFSGWSLSWQLPKPAIPYITEGSVYLFSTYQSIDALLPTFEALEHYGMGECRNEGFGRVEICAPFHTEVKPV